MYFNTLIKLDENIEIKIDKGFHVRVVSIDLRKKLNNGDYKELIYYMIKLRLNILLKYNLFKQRNFS